jgi:hypothetical protein
MKTVSTRFLCLLALVVALLALWQGPDNVVGASVTDSVIERRRIPMKILSAKGSALGQSYRSHKSSRNVLHSGISGALAGAVLCETS